MATQDIGQHFSKRNSFSIDSILRVKNDRKELIKIPKLTSVLDGKTLSLTENNSVTNVNEMQGAKALDLSVNIHNVVDETSRKSLKNHTQINNINGLYTNSVLSDLQHLAKAKNKQYVSTDVERSEPFQNMLKREMEKDDDIKFRYFSEEIDRRENMPNFDNGGNHDFVSPNDSDAVNSTSVTIIDTESVDLSSDEVAGVDNDEAGTIMTVEDDSTTSDGNFEKPVKYENELIIDENPGLLSLLLSIFF